MPSASAKLEKQTSTETFDPVKQVLTIVEKKVRNLEKRKGKLDSYRQDSANGKELNEDQKKAVEKYDQVVEILEVTKDLQKQFQTVIQDFSKAQKKAAKREQLERQQNELQRIKEIISYQDLLNSMGGEDIRNDFLNGNNGAVKLTEEELNSLDELYKAICPDRESEKENGSDFEEMLSAAAEHIQALLDSKNKEIFGTTYKALKETLLKIQSCSYFNKNESDIPNEEESNNNVQEEQENSTAVSESQFSQQSDANIRNETEESAISSQSGLPSTQVERPFYPIESSSLYSDQNHPIQEVLSVQGNLNFLQESQIELESSRTNSQVPTAPVGPSYPNVQFSTASQSMAPSSMVAHCTRQSSGDAANISASPAANNMVLANSATLPPQQVGSSIPASVPLQQTTTQAIDFDPARPIPTQTYTNQSFTSAIHPMMAAAVSQNYVPVVTLPHAIPPPHVLSQNMVVQPLPPRSTVASTLPSNPNLPMAPTHTPQLNENSQPTCVPSTQFECSDVQDSNMVKNSNSTFVNARDSRAAPREQRARGGANNAYTRNPNQVGFSSEQAYQSTNNSQGFVNRDSFTDNSSYSSNLKRGLNSRGGSRGNNSSRGANTNRGTRGGYRN